MPSAMRVVVPAIGLILLAVMAFGLVSTASAQDPADDGPAPSGMEVSVTPSESWSCIRDQHELTAILMDGGSAVSNGQIEFILNRFPAAVGDIVELGGNGASKLTNTYATVNTGPDGQASATLVATRPGDTDVTVFAPGIADASAHKVFGVVHWVDGCPEFPGDADNPAGTPHPMSVSVLRVSDGGAVQGVPVRWTIIDDDPDARFADATGDGNTITVSTDASGLSSVSLEQVTENVGHNSVLIEVLTRDGRTMFSHTMVKQWRAPLLTVSATGPDTIGLLSEATYDITVENEGDSPATESMLTMALPDGMNFVSATDGGTEADGVVTWDLGTVEVGDSVAVSVTAEGVEIGLQTSALEVVSAEGLSDRTTVGTTVIAGALTVTKTGDAEVAVGSQITYYIQVLSTGTGANTEVEVVDTLPDGVSFVSSNMAATQDGNEISVELGTLNPDEQMTVEIVVTADEPGVRVNQATATSAEGATDSSEATTTVVQPMLEITKEGPATALLNTEFNYTITVTNVGDGEATGTSVVDTLDSGLEPVSSSRDDGRIVGSTVRWDIGTIDAGASETIVLRVRGVAGGDQENVASASTEGSTIAPEARATTTILVPDISLEKAGRSAMFVGNEATFTLTVSNTGEAPLTDVTITEDIPDGMSYVSSTPEGTVSADGRQVVWDIGTLALEGASSVSVTLQADEEGTVTNTASASASEDVSDSSSIDILVLPATGAHIQITDSSDPVRVGEVVEYTVMVTNQGDQSRSAMTGVSVTVAISDAMTVTSTSSDQAVISEDGSTVTFDRSDPLAAAASFSFSITVEANALPEGENRVDAVTTATLTFNEFSAPIRTEEGTTVIEE